MILNDQHVMLIDTHTHLVFNTGNGAILCPLSNKNNSYKWIITRNVIQPKLYYHKLLHTR